MKQFLVLAAILAIASAQSSNFTLYFNGGLPFCSQCGTQGSYACAADAAGPAVGNWNNGLLTFMDPLPSNAVPLKFTYKLFGTWSCSPTISDSTFGIQLNGITHATRAAYDGNTDCECNTCNNAHTLTFEARNGVPNYQSGRNNTLQVIMFRNSICLNRVEVSIDYSTSGSELPFVWSKLNLAGQSQGQDIGCAVCHNGTSATQWCSYTSSTTPSAVFNLSDPLPTGALLVGVDLYFSYNYISKSYSSSYPTGIRASIGTQEIGYVTVSDSTWRDRCSCMGEGKIVSTYYQRGWPGYVYKGMNHVTVSLSKYYATYGDICFGRIDADLIYYFATDLDQTLHRMSVQSEEGVATVI